MTVTEGAIASIRAMIVSGELLPGGRLPPEKELSEHLGLSRNSLREAVKALELIRVLDVRQGDGTYVTSLEPQLLLEAMSFVVDLHHDRSIIEMFEVRQVLEPYAAGLAATLITQEQVDELRTLLDSVDDNTSIEALVERDTQFHRLIAEASGNRYLASMLTALSSETVRARVWRGLTQNNSVSRTLSEHRSIVDALAQHSPELARSWITVHVTGIESWLKQSAR